MKFKNILVILVVSTMVLLVGCTKNSDLNDSNNNNNNSKADENKADDKQNVIQTKPDVETKQDAETKQDTETKTVTLYFPDENGEYVIPEARIVKKLEPLEILKELQRGSLVNHKEFMFSKDIIIKSVLVKEKIAIIDFDESIYGKISGSTGETLTLASIINTLTMNKSLGIDKVQFDVNGIPIQTLGGHVDVSLPKGPMKEYIKK